MPSLECYSTRISGNANGSELLGYLICVIGSFFSKLVYAVSVETPGHQSMSFLLYILFLLPLGSLVHEYI